MDETYFQALEYTQRTTREGIDGALAGSSSSSSSGGSRRLDALLVPPDVGQTYQIAAQAQYPMITIPAGVGGVSGMPFGLAFMGSRWSEAELVRWASAVEDLQLSSSSPPTPWRRQRPSWGDYLAKNLPVLWA